MTLSSSPARILQSRLKRGLALTLTSINEFLTFLSNSHRFELVSHFFFSQLTPNKIAGNSQTRSIVAGTLINLRRLDDAERFISAAGAAGAPRLWEALLRRRCTDEDSDPEKALILLRRFLGNDLGKSRFPSSSIALSSLIRRFASAGVIGKAVEILDLISELEYPFGRFVFGSAVAELCRTGNPSAAVRLSAAVRSDLRDRALTCRMVKGIKPSLIESESGIEFDEFFYAARIGGFCVARDFGRVFDLLEDMEKKRVSLGIVTYNTLIDRLFIGDDFEGNIAGDTIASNVLIKALFLIGEIDEAREVFERMGSSTNADTFLTMVRGFCRSVRFDEAVEFLVKLGERGLTLRIFGDLIDKEGPEIVERLLESCDIPFCDAVVSLFDKGYLEPAFRVLAAMKAKGLTLTSESYYRALKALILRGFDEAGSNLLTRFLKHYGLEESRVRKALVVSLCLNRDSDHALSVAKRMERNYGITPLPRRLFKELIKRGRALDPYELLRKAEEHSIVLPRMDAVDYSRLVNSLCKRGYIAEALDLAVDYSLDISTYNSVVNGLCSQGRTVEAFRVFDSLKRLGFAPNESTYSILLDALCREALINDARELFERMIQDGIDPKTRNYNSLIDALCRVGRVNEAQKLIEDLESKGLKPDEFTVSSMINGFCYNGDMEGALDCFSEFKARKEKNVLPDFLGFKYLIRGLSSKGRIEESRSVIREMLRCPSVVELINVVDTGGEETLEELLSSLCYRGRVREAVSVIDEVASMFFPRWKSGLGVRELEPRNDSMKVSKRGGFESYYLRIASLCSQGEIQRASKLAKDLLPELD